jgi:hypothetical protein
MLSAVDVLSGILIAMAFHLTLCDMCGTVPAPTVNSTWRPDDVVIPFITQYPLTLEMMKKGFPDFKFERIARYYNIYSKLSCKKPINILVLGGSFTYGTKCCVGSAWPDRFVIWLRRAYPGAKINLISRALGSTSSLYGMHVIHEHKDIDLIFVDYCLNDAGSLAHHKEKVMSAVTEGIVRTMTLKGAAVVYVSECMYGQDIEQIYRNITDHYDAMLLSYRAAVADKVFLAEAVKGFDPAHHLGGNKVRYSIYWTRESYRPHPNWVTHQLMADMMVELFLAIGARIRLFTRDEVARSVSNAFANTVPPMLFMHDEQVGSRLAGAVMCHPALVVFSTLEAGTSPFTKPYFHGTDKKWQVMRNSFYYEGWGLKEDVPGKPQGWIADSSTRPANATAAHIIFPILLSSGQVSITYLSSYENCGVVEVWLTFIDPATHSGKVSSGGGIISCCNTSAYKYGLYPQKGMGMTNSAFLDTLDTSAKVSEMRTVTYNFGVAGSLGLNLLHTRLPGDELARRKGDKVKILGIKSC